MSKFKQGQIWLVNFDPSVGHEYRKVRPALIIQSDQYIKPAALLTVIPISSQINKQSELDILLKKDIKNRLMTDSLIKTKQISSFDSRRFFKLIGVASEEMLEEVKANIIQFLALESKQKSATK